MLAATVTLLHPAPPSANPQDPWALWRGGLGGSPCCQKLAFFGVPPGAVCSSKMQVGQKQGEKSRGPATLSSGFPSTPIPLGGSRNQYKNQGGGGGAWGAQ